MSARRWMTGALLFLAVLAAYSPAWHAGFIWDDETYVTGNRLLTAPDGLWRIWFSFDSPSQYFPLVYTTFRIEHALWGLAPSGYHWVNILFHAANALLLWRLLERLAVPGSLLAAAIFALHPVQVESVAWVTELKNVQMGFFFLLSLLAWTAFTGERQKRDWRFYGLSLVLYALALFSKTTACTLPAALLLLAWLRGERIGRRMLIEVLPFVALGIGMGLLTVLWERYHQGTQGKLFTMGFADRLLIASHAVWFYLGKLFWPAKLTFSYPRWPLRAANPAAWAWLAGLCALGWAAWFSRRFAGPGICVAFAFYVLTLGPTLGFIMLYTFRYTFVADHYQYLACIGPIAVVSAGIQRLRERSPGAHPLAARCLILILPGALALLTWRQAATYRDLETLWRTTIARNPESWMAQNDLGYLLFKEGRMQEAIDRYREALRINPADGETHNNLGLALYEQGQIESAIAEYRDALQLDPTLSRAHRNLGNALFELRRVPEAIAEYRETLRLDPADADAHCNLGVALCQQGRVMEGIAECQEAVRLDPALADAHGNLAAALAQQGRTAEAMAQYDEAVRLNPADFKAHGELGNLLLGQGRTGEAIVQYRDAIRLNPSNAEMRCNLGNALLLEGQAAEAMAEMTKAQQIEPANPAIENALAWVLAAAAQPSLRDGPRSLALASQANQATGGNNPVVLRTLAAAYAQTGQFPDAVRTAQKALQLARDRGNIHLADALLREAGLYEAGHPFDPAH